MKPRLSAKITTAWVVVLAFIIGVYSLRGAPESEITFTDEARHAMNGVALMDMVYDGAILRPVSYLHDYFGHFPALSIPYHPPLFPAMEAIYFAIFGVRPFSARLAVASFVVGSVLLLFNLILRTHEDAWLATSVVLAFFSLHVCQLVAADVMLEMPALFFVLASLNFMVGVGDQWSVRNACIAAALGAAGVWTKQTIYVGLIPPLMAVIAGRWSFWRSASTYVFGAVFATGTLAYMALAAYAGLGMSSRGWAQVDLVPRIVRNLFFYSQVFRSQSTLLLLLISLAAFAVWFLWGHKQEARTYLHPLYVAWAVAVGVVLLIVPAFDARYLLFAYPPLILITFHLARSLLLRYVGPRSAHAVLLMLALGVVAVNGRATAPFMKGPAIAAKYVYDAGGRRVLFGGSTNGGYIFRLRELDPARTSVVLRADKLPASVFEEQAFESFARRYGIDYIVLEKGFGFPAAWDRLIRAPSSSMHLQSTVAITVSESQGPEALYIYRFLNPSPPLNPKLEFPVLSTGETMELNISPSR